MSRAFVFRAQYHHALDHTINRHAIRSRHASVAIRYHTAHTSCRISRSDLFARCVPDDPPDMRRWHCSESGCNGVLRELALLLMSSVNTITKIMPTRPAFLMCNGPTYPDADMPICADFARMANGDSASPMTVTTTTL